MRATWEPNNALVLALMLSRVVGGCHSEPRMPALWEALPESLVIVAACGQTLAGKRVSRGNATITCTVYRNTLTNRTGLGGLPSLHHGACSPPSLAISLKVLFYLAMVSIGSFEFFGPVGDQ